jgi:hypothetical protein
MENYTKAVEKFYINDWRPTDNTSNSAYWENRNSIKKDISIPILKDASENTRCKEISSCQEA